MKNIKRKVELYTELSIVHSLAGIGEYFTSDKDCPGASLVLFSAMWVGTIKNHS